MHTEFRHYRNLLNNLELGTTPDQLKSAAVQLTDGIERYHRDFCTLAERAGEDTPLPDEDIRVLKACTELPDPSVRREAIWFLCNIGPITWDDVETWATDPDLEVREAACEAVAYGLDAVCDLCTSDMERCGSLFDLVFVDDKRFGQLDVERSVPRGNRKLLEAAWRGTGIILDLGRPHLSEVLTIGCLENAIHDLSHDDPLIRDWIDGDSPQRKMALLAVVGWFGLRTPGQRDIAERLSKDADKAVSDAAKDTIEWTTETRSLEDN